MEGFLMLNQVEHMLIVTNGFGRLKYVHKHIQKL